MTTKIARHLFGVEEALTITTRTIKGQHWYAAVDVCNLLCIANHSQAVHRKRGTDELTLIDKERTMKNVWNGSSKRRMLFVNDNGMLKLILQGTSERARDVQGRARQASPNMMPSGWNQALLNPQNIAD